MRVIILSGLEPWKTIGVLSQDLTQKSCKKASKVVNFTIKIANFTAKIRILTLKIC